MDTSPIANALVAKARRSGRNLEVTQIIPLSDEIMGPIGFRATFMLDGVETHVLWRVFDAYMPDFARLIPDERARDIEWIAADVDNFKTL